MLTPIERAQVLQLRESGAPVVVGLGLILLSFRRGPVFEEYRGLNRNVR